MKDIGRILRVVGIAIGIITALTLVSQHPIQIGILGLSAVVYFVGMYLKKKAK